MSPDDRVDLIKHIPEERRERILSGLAQVEREDIPRLAAYPEGTAGAVMTSEYALLQPGAYNPGGHYRAANFFQYRRMAAGDLRVAVERNPKKLLDKNLD